MDRRDTILALLALGSAPLASVAQQRERKVWRVGFLAQRRVGSLESDFFGAFPRGMRELGYVEGKNLIIEWRSADGVYERLPALAAELVRLNVDVIVAGGTQAVGAAQKATTTIPIVMGTIYDPVGAGFVKSLARPGGNVTGLSNLTSDLSPKHLEMLLSMTPKLSRVAVLINPENSRHSAILSSIRTAAQRTGIRIFPAEARSPREIESAFSRMDTEDIGAVIIALDTIFNQQQRQIAELAVRHRLPSMASIREYVQAGGLMSYGQNLADNFRHAAIYVDKIFKGAKPADLPVEQSTTFELVINLKTAKVLGLTIPQTLLFRADEVIQ